MKIYPTQNQQIGDVTAYVATEVEQTPDFLHTYLKKHTEKQQNIVVAFPLLERPLVVALLLEKGKDTNAEREKARQLGNELLTTFKKEKYTEVYIHSSADKDLTMCVLEGMQLSDYQFNKYKTKEDSQPEISVYVDLPVTELTQFNNLLASVAVARDLVNEPPLVLTTTRLSEEIEVLSKHFGFEVSVLRKQEIQDLKMGGLLGVNAGSEVPPTFNILTWKPKNAENQQPYVFVGKGVVYDTGGYNIKPGNYMDTMKADMAGAAAVVGLLCAVAKNQLPLHVVGLIPATDNRINSNAIVSDDVLTMMNGMTVEIKNTDAEGRLILADALTYAQRLNPELVIDLATLTGAAARVTGHYGSAFMGNASDEIKKRLQRSGDKVFERLVELPFWDEFGEDLKSPIADIKNLGNPEGGASSAGKFLEHFTNYPWVHIDIAGTAFLNAPFRYFKAGGTGVGIRLLYDFLSEVSTYND